MDNNELILNLIGMLNTKHATNQTSQITCWITEWKTNGKSVKTVAKPINLKDRAKLLSSFTPFDERELEYYLFAPFGDNRWRVFALDINAKVLSQLENYEGKIMVPDGTNQKEQEDSFCIKV